MSFIKCPICNNPFKSDACPHSYGQAEERKNRNKEDKRLQKLVKKIVEQTLKEYGLIP